MKKLLSIIAIAFLISCSTDESKKESGEQDCVKGIYDYGVTGFNGGTPVWGYTYLYNQDYTNSDEQYNDGNYHQIDNDTFFKINCQ